jgi:hypothetical protein
MNERRNETRLARTAARRARRRRADPALRIVGIIILLILGVVLLPEIEMLPMALPHLQALLP